MGRDTVVTQAKKQTSASTQKKNLGVNKTSRETREAKAPQIFRRGGEAAAYKRACGIYSGFGAREGVDVRSR